MAPRGECDRSGDHGDRVHLAPARAAAVRGRARRHTPSSGLTSAHATLVGFYCVTVPMFTAAAWQPRSRAFAGLAYWVVGSVGVAVAGHESAAGFAGGLVLSCLLWAAGRLSRSQRLLAERVAENHPLLIAEREEPERLAIASERARIAREDRRCRARLGRGPPRRCRGRLRAPLG